MNQVKLGQFIRYEEFKLLTPDEKVEWINSIIDTYGVGLGAIGTYVFDKASSTLWMHMHSLDVSDRIHTYEEHRKNLNAFRRKVYDWKYSGNDEGGDSMVWGNSYIPECLFNRHIECSDYDHCAHCGWNPRIEKERKYVTRLKRLSDGLSRYYTQDPETGTRSFLMENPLYIGTANHAQPINELYYAGETDELVVLYARKR